MTFIKPFRLNYGDGSDGAITLTGTVGKQVYQLADGAAISNLTLSQSYLPSIIRCQGTLTISGNINGAGKGNAGGTQEPSWGHMGVGPGGGEGGQHNRGIAESYAGAGGGHGAAGTSTSYVRGGSAYDSLGAILRGVYGAHCVGSGGGSGGAHGSGGTGGAGGVGGGGLILVARHLVINAVTISLNGTNGGNAGGDGTVAGGGGGGSGGLFVALANTITLPGSGVVITAAGGSGGSGISGGNSGTAGGVGRIYLVPITSISGDLAARCEPDGVLVDLTAYSKSLG